jgi:hypothetical protein
VAALAVKSKPNDTLPPGDFRLLIAAINRGVEREIVDEAIRATRKTEPSSESAQTYANSTRRARQDQINAARRVRRNQARSIRESHGGKPGKPCLPGRRDDRRTRPLVGHSERAVLSPELQRRRRLPSAKSVWDRVPDCNPLPAPLSLMVRARPFFIPKTKARNTMKFFPQVGA